MKLALSFVRAGGRTRRIGVARLLLLAFACCAVSGMVRGHAAAQEVDSANSAHAGSPSVDPASASASARASATVSPLIEAQTRELAKELRCPVCQGMSIEDSPTELSNQMKGVIREQLQAGRTPDEVKAYFVARYGEWILLRPKASGVNLLVYVLPWLALLAGGAVVYFALRRWTRAEAVET